MPAQTLHARSQIPVQPPHSIPIKSYWHYPPSPLARHRSSEQLPETADTVVIGSGITGALVAWGLLERGETGVVMLEARDAVGGATGRNGGHTKAASYRTFPTHARAHSPHTAALIARLELANIRATHAFAAAHAIPCASRPCATVDAIYDRATFDAGVAAIEQLRAELGDEDEAGVYEVLGPEEAAGRFSVARQREAGQGVEDGHEELAGAFAYEAGSINAYAFTSGVLQLCLARGLRLYTHTPATSALPCWPAPTAARVAQGYAFAVPTPRGTVLARRVVLCTNGYTAHLLPRLTGVCVPLRGQISALAVPRGSNLPMLDGTYSFMYKGGYEYMIPRVVAPPGEGGQKGAAGGAQHIVIGGGLGRLPRAGASEYGTVDDSTLNTHVSAYLAGAGEAYFGANWTGRQGSDETVPAQNGPGEEKEKNKENTTEEKDTKRDVVREWTGIMGVTPDDMPFVGPVPVSLYTSPGSPSPGSNLFLAAGFNGHGMALSLKCAEALVSIISGSGVPTWFPDAFLISEERVRRTGEGDFWGRSLDVSGRESG